VTPASSLDDMGGELATRRETSFEV
jgi:hypothetical protein